MTRDYIDNLTHTEPDTPQTSVERSVTGARIMRCMVVPGRAVSSEEIEAREAEYLSRDILPIPVWDEFGQLEPLTSFDLDALETAGVTPEQWEIAVIEEQLERNPQ